MAEVIARPFRANVPRLASPAPALALFDIDGTLTRRAGPHHKDALVEAVYRVTGRRAEIDHLPLHGMLDPVILAWMMRDAGVTAEDIRAAMPEVLLEAQRIYAATCPDIRTRVCPGARTLLHRLEQKGVLLALVTGNLSRIGWKKMERAGLKRFFRFGAFSEMAATRAGLARIAIRSAIERGWLVPGASVTLIGDSPADVLAAKANGIRSIAVCTGISTPEELTAYRPDLLVRDLRARRVEAALLRPAL